MKILSKILMSSMLVVGFTTNVQSTINLDQGNKLATLSQSVTYQIPVMGCIPAESNTPSCPPGQVWGHTGEWATYTELWCPMTPVPGGVAMGECQE